MVLAFHTNEVLRVLLLLDHIGIVYCEEGYFYRCVNIEAIHLLKENSNVNCPFIVQAVATRIYRSLNRRLRLPSQCPDPI